MTPPADRQGAGPAVDETRARLVRARLLGERVLYRLPSRSDGSPTPVEAPTSVEGGLDLAAWEEVRAEALVCRKCNLCETRTTVVWGSGTPRTRLLVIGEAPGHNEDQQGEAFVGAAGQLLTKILAAIGFGRDDVFITNVLKCRPPRNADPQPHQVAACEPYLVRQIEIIGPAAILALGRHAAHTLLRTDAAMGALRGRVFRYQEVPLVATYHPAALLRNPNLKRPTWDDVQLLRRVYDEAVAAPGGDGGNP